MDPETGFEPCALVANAARVGGSLEEVANRAAKLIMQPLTRAAERVRRNNPEEFQQRFAVQPVQIILMRIEEDAPTYFAIAFEPENRPDGSLIFEPTGYNSPGNRERGFDLALLGQHEAIDLLLKKYPKFWESGLAVADAVRFLVSLEVIDKSEDVQPPTDVLRITKNGGEWIQKKKECPDVQK